MAEENGTTETTNNSDNADNSGKVKKCRRKTSHKIMIIGGVAAVIGAAAFAGAAHSSGWGGCGHGYGHGKHGHMMKMFQEFDANGDGKVSTEELNAVRVGRFADANSNGDGSLNLAEFENLWLEFMRPHMVDKFQMLDDDGDGEVTEKEFEKPFNMVLRHMDRNDDGAISMKEIKRKRYWDDDDDDDDND